MGIFDYLKDLSSKIGEKLLNEEDIFDSTKKFDVITEAISSSHKTFSYITNFPQIEFIARKESNKEKPLPIEYYRKKYIADELDDKIKAMSDREKSYFYYFLGLKTRNTNEFKLAIDEKMEMALKYLEKAFSYSKDNIDIAYEIFHICSLQNSNITKERSVDIGEICIKLSNNIDIKNKFSDIYYQMGKYYRKEAKDYKKAIDCYNNSLAYAKIEEERKKYIYEELAYSYEDCGDYKSALNTWNYINELNKGDNFYSYYRDIIVSSISRLEKYIKDNIKKEDIDRENKLSDIKLLFNNSKGYYSDEELEKAYDIFLNARELSRQKRRKEAIKEYERLKRILPSEFNLFDRHICLQKRIERDEQEEATSQENQNIRFNQSESVNEYFEKGNTSFNNGDYCEAVIEYKKSSEKQEDNLEVFFRLLLAMDIYVVGHSDGLEFCLKLLEKCFIKKSFKYLPFIYTVMGDVESYQEFEKNDVVSEYYDIATFLLNMLPEKDRFAAPYYKLGRIKEAKKNYKEALKLFEQAKRIDATYKIDDDIQRIKMIIEDVENFKRKAASQIQYVKDYRDTYETENLFYACREALKYIPNNVEALYIFCNAAEKLNKYYEFKWATKEYLRVSSSEYKNEIHLYELLFSLGKICKYEKKYAEAKYYFSSIVNDEDLNNNTMRFEAQAELESCENYLK